MIDGRLSSSGVITTIASLRLKILGRVRAAPFLVNKLGNYPLVLGIL